MNSKDNLSEQEMNNISRHRYGLRHLVNHNEYRKTKKLEKDVLLQVSRDIGVEFKDVSLVVHRYKDVIADLIRRGLFDLNINGLCAIRNIISVPKKANHGIAYSDKTKPFTHAKRKLKLHIYPSQQEYAREQWVEDEYYDKLYEPSRDGKKRSSSEKSLKVRYRTAELTKQDKIDGKII